MVAIVLPTTATIMGDSLLYVVLPVTVAGFGIHETWGLSPAFWVGFALSINRFIRLGSNAAAAAAYRRFGFRAPFVSATLLGAATTLAYAFGSGLIVLLLARALWGVCYSFLRLAAYLGALESGSERMRGRLLGFFNASSRLGSFVAVTAGAALVAATDRAVGFAAVAGVGLLGLAVALKARPLTVSPPERAHAGALPGPGGRTAGGRIWDFLLSSPPEADGGPAHAARLRWRLLGISLLRFATTFTANGLVIATVSPYVAELAQADRTAFGVPIVVLTLAGLLVGARWLSDLALSLPLGHLSDRIGRRTTVIAGMAVTLGALALIVGSNTAEALIAGLPLLFVSNVAVSVALDAEMGESVPDEARVAALGRYTTWLDLGAALGPFAGLPVAEWIGFRAAYLIAGAIMLAVTLAYLGAGRRSPVKKGRVEM
jgi:MFS family permease